MKYCTDCKEKVDVLLWIELIYGEPVTLERCSKCNCIIYDKPIRS